MAADYSQDRRRTREARSPTSARAKDLMVKCREAVPVWIMPLSRVVEQFDPISTRFDVLIVDEASQSDAFALLAMTMARKVVIVGDDEQVSPMAVGTHLHRFRT